MYIFPLVFFSFPDEWTLRLKSIFRQEQSAVNRISMSLNDFRINMPKADVERKVGKEKLNLLNSSNHYWSIYHENYQQMTFIQYDNNKISSLFLYRQPFELNGIQYKMPKDEVEKILGEPSKTLEGRSTILKLNANHELMYEDENNVYTYYFDDIDNQLVGVKIVPRDIATDFNSIYSVPSESLANNFATIDYLLINASRVNKNLKPLSFDKHLAITSKKHSEDMAKNNYFSHTNLKGETPFDRMESDGVIYQFAGENIAMGQFDAVQAHNDLMNSPVHRKNILGQQFKKIGIGIAFNEQMQPYYTENYKAD